MKNDHPHDPVHSAHDLRAAPLTLEGSAILHQFFRIRRAEFNAAPAAIRTRAIEGAASAMAAMERREGGESAFFSEIGHKGDLIAVHFRRTFDELEEAQREIAALALNEFLELSYSYVSVVEIGLYEATVKLHAELAQKGIRPGTPEWLAAVEDGLADQRGKLGARLSPAIPARRYICFYPMNKRRDGADNWYALPIEERQRLMRDHGMIGRRYADRVTQVISGSIGFDDWEWGVDLFADDPLIFKKLVYEMRFDESSARYAEFGPFYFGIRLNAADIGRLISASDHP